ncbi:MULTISPECIES: CD3324 family protein [Paenibacillus]|uniref:CD3324 family protein n=1 Tax=Paenibacillus residui TaxID=629724 RepID=A0ABW3D8R4_9BACL|nr:CD3324 family protein [Paenibacillus sp. 32O-W]
MKYENAGDVLPEELLKEIQKYAAGKLLYIPSGEEKRAWGEMSGYRDQLQRRNLMIRNKYANGITVSELADEYIP